VSCIAAFACQLISVTATSATFVSKIAALQSPDASFVYRFAAFAFRFVTFVFRVVAFVSSSGPFAYGFGR
jgi:hypothetical protein